MCRSIYTSGYGQIDGEEEIETVRNRRRETDGQINI